MQLQYLLEGWGLAGGVFQQVVEIHREAAVAVRVPTGKWVVGARLQLQSFSCQVGECCVPYMALSCAVVVGLGFRPTWSQQQAVGTEMSSCTGCVSSQLRQQQLHVGACSSCSCSCAGHADLHEDKQDDYLQGCLCLL